MPTEQNTVLDKKKVRLEMLSALGLQDIEVRMLPEGLVYTYYWAGKNMELELLL